MRLYLEGFSPGTPTPLTQRQAHHVCHVLRLKTGDTVTVFNATAGAWSATITVHKKGAEVTPTAQLQPAIVHPGPMLAFCPLKPDPMAWLLEKATELGIAALQPIISHRTVMRQFNTARAYDQIVDATQQCGRFDVPRLLPILSLPDWIRTVQGSVLTALEPAMQPHAGTPILPITQALAGLDVCAITLLIGPEGGFTVEEVQLLARAGVCFISLGVLTLRAETAALVGLAHIQLKNLQI